MILEIVGKVVVLLVGLWCFYALRTKPPSAAGTGKALEPSPSAVGDDEMGDASAFEKLILGCWRKYYEEDPVAMGPDWSRNLVYYFFEDGTFVRANSFSFCLEVIFDPGSRRFSPKSIEVLHGSYRLLNGILEIQHEWKGKVYKVSMPILRLTSEKMDLNNPYQHSFLLTRYERV